jgi:hypothetical protein
VLVLGTTYLSFDWLGRIVVVVAFAVERIHETEHPATNRHRHVSIATVRDGILRRTIALLHTNVPISTY